MKVFTFASSTRSGTRYNPFPVVPVALPPTFELGELLKLAVNLDVDQDLEEDFFIALEGAHPSATSSNDTLQPAGGGTYPASPSTSRKRPAECVNDLESERREEREDGQLSAKKRRKIAYRKKRNDKRILKTGHAPKKKNVSKHIQVKSKVVVPITLSELPATQCGYRALNLKEAGVSYSLDALIAEGYGIIPFAEGTSRPLVDGKTGKVFGVVVYGMDDPTYLASCRAAFNFLENIQQSGILGHKDEAHRRGSFPAVHYGVSYGQGPKKPYALNCRHEEMMRRVLENDHIVRLATYSSYLFSMWAPKVYRYYKERLDKLYDHMPELTRNFSRSIWPCATVNFGPQVCTKSHRDSLNCPFGWCAIQALGEFDHTRGGHLVLPDLKLAIEFPPGAVILIPSATLTHGNTPVQSGERRMSFTQFCAGGLFRFVDNKFHTEEELKREDRDMYEKMMDEKKGRWEMGIGLWSTLEEILREK